eukprot:7377468-Prymnesium_polylepis.3
MSHGTTSVISPKFMSASLLAASTARDGGEWRACAARPRGSCAASHLRSACTICVIHVVPHFG